MESKIFQIDAFWDAESSVWVATSDDVPGLATEADSFEVLQEKLRGMVPELLMLNRVIAEDYTGSISFLDRSTLGDRTLVMWIVPTKV